MKNKGVKIGLIAAIFPHIFCCGIPMVLAVLGVVAPDFAHFHLLPHWLEPWLFVFSGVMLAVSWWMVLRDCRCGCARCDSGHAHRFQRIVLVILSVVTLFSFVAHIFLHSHV